MAYTLTLEELSTFTGRPVESFSPFTETAIAQAILLFRLATCTDDYSPNPLLRELAQNAIAAAADSIALAQPHTVLMSQPFSSESLGSYSYSKMAQAVAIGKATGVPWFDMAVSQLSRCHLRESHVPTSGGIQVFQGYGSVDPEPNNGYFHFLSPEERRMSADWGYDPSGSYRA